ncbi:hypothetical protein OAT24_02815 [Gammaproteobacteria bacterium]|nr:hypothetical protein [Gammaproteobacteria bacterium]
MPALLLLAIFLAFIEGFRMPNLWSINYYIPSFFDGFYRRSFGGTLLYIFGDIRFNYYFIAFLQFVILFLLLFFIYRIVRNHILPTILASLYFLSPLGGYLFHQVGYIEQLLYLLAFVSIYLLEKNKIFFALLIMTCSMFFHEITLLTTLPFFFFCMFYNNQDIKTSLKLVFFPISAFLLIYLFFQTVSLDSVNTLIENIKINASYEIREGYFNVFRNEFLGNRMKFYYTLDNLFIIFLVISLCVIMLFSFDWSDKNTLLKFFFIAPILAPLILGFLGWDTDRWIFLSLTNFTIMANIAYKKNIELIAKDKMRNYLYLIIFIIFFSMPDLHYFDGYKPRHEVSKQSLIEIYEDISKLPSR